MRELGRAVDAAVYAETTPKSAVAKSALDKARRATQDELDIILGDRGGTP
jgi:hypothetical protein